jgi:hypothetical protein
LIPAIPAVLQERHSIFTCNTQAGLACKSMCSAYHITEHADASLIYSPHDALSFPACVEGLNAVLSHEMEERFLLSIPSLESVFPTRRAFPHFLLKQESTLNNKNRSK